MGKVKNMIGWEEGDVCNRNGCTGTMEFRPDGDCYCHIVSPCSPCENSKIGLR